MSNAVERLIDDHLRIIKAKDAEIAELKKVLSEVKQCKIGDLVVYNPNGEDKDAAFVAGLVASVQNQNEKLQHQLTQATALLTNIVKEQSVDDFERHVQEARATLSKLKSGKGEL